MLFRMLFAAFATLALAFSAFAQELTRETAAEKASQIVGSNLIVTDTAPGQPAPQTGPSTVAELEKQVALQAKQIAVLEAAIKARTAPNGPVAYQQICENGVCRLVPIQGGQAVTYGGCSGGSCSGGDSVGQPQAAGGCSGNGTGRVGLFRRIFRGGGCRGR